MYERMTGEDWWKDTEKEKAKYSVKTKWPETKPETICLVNRSIKFYCENCSFSRFICELRL